MFSASFPQNIINLLKWLRNTHHETPSWDCAHCAWLNVVPHVDQWNRVNVFTRKRLDCSHDGNLKLVINFKWFKLPIKSDLHQNRKHEDYTKGGWKIAPHLLQCRLQFDLGCQPWRSTLKRGNFTLKLTFDEAWNFTQEASAHSASKQWAVKALNKRRHQNQLNSTASSMRVHLLWAPIDLLLLKHRKYEPKSYVTIIDMRTQKNPALRCRRWWIASTVLCG